MSRERELTQLTDDARRLLLGVQLIRESESAAGGAPPTAFEVLIERWCERAERLTQARPTR